MSVDPTWLLLGRDGESAVRCIGVGPAAIVVGRSRSCDLLLKSKAASARHAQVWLDGQTPYVRDLDSSNGVFVNGRRIDGCAALSAGDQVQFADATFRVHFGEPPAECTGDAADQQDIQKLIEERRVETLYRPVVSLEDASVVGYEVFGTAKAAGIESPQALFVAAGQLDLDLELSRVIRNAAVSGEFADGERPHLFLKTHPREVVDFGLHYSLCDLRETQPEQPLTLQIQLSASEDVEVMRSLQLIVRSLGMALAFTDVGAADALELWETMAPDYVFFDEQLTRGLDSSDPKSRKIARRMVETAEETGICTVATGVETCEQHEACRELGFDLAAGFFYGRPTSGDATDTQRLPDAALL